MELGLLLLGTGLALGVRSLLARLTEVGDNDSLPSEDFAARHEHLWATVGPRVAVSCIGVGTVIAVLAVALR